jgi:N-acetylglucosaminyl-diphospho-decaprenol L-rhamnosyltransferase
MSSIHALILNYNGLSLLQECLPSVLAAAERSPVPCKVSVIDNASTDGSFDWLRRAHPGVGWIARPDNRILFAYNAVVPGLPEDLLLILNNDIKPDPDCIAPLLQALLGRPEAFAASPRHVDFNGAYNGGMNRCGRRLSLAWSGPAYPGAEAESHRPGETLFTGNGLFRRDKFTALGGFDELYAHMGWEDADLGARAWGRGWPTLYVPTSVIHHKSSASMQRRFSLHQRRALGFRNGTLWLAANAPTAELLKALLLAPLTIVACLLTGRWAQIHGFLASLLRLPQALARRSGAAQDRTWWARFSAGEGG